MAVELAAVVRVTDVELQAVQRAELRVRRRFFGRAGGAIRKTARRSLRKARQKRKGELSPEGLTAYTVQLQRFKTGKRTSKPRRPEIISEPGNPPLLHDTKSPLKHALSYRIEGEARGVVIGPERTKSNLSELEASRPWMRPAFEKIEPRLPEYLAASSE